MTTTEYNQAMESESKFEDEHHYYAGLERQQYEESKPNVVTELIEYMQIIQDFDKDSAQDATALHAYLIHLTQIMARANLLMAEYNKKFREEKKQAYLKLAASSQAQQKYYSVSLAKDYIDSQCSDSGYVYDVAERCSRLCSHTLDAVRSITSSLKSERQFASYG